MCCCCSRNGVSAESYAAVGAHYGKDWGLAKMNELCVADDKLRTSCGEMLINAVCPFANSRAHLETTEA